MIRVSQGRTRTAKRLRAVFVLLLSTALSACAATPAPINSSLQVPPTTPQSAEHITADEYRAAVTQYRTCVTDLGARVGELEALPHGQLGFSLEFDAATDNERVAKSDQIAACRVRHLDATARKWINQNKPTAEDIEKMKPKLIQCLRDGGVEMADDVTRDQLIERLRQSTALRDSQRAQACLKSFQDFFSA